MTIDAKTARQTERIAGTLHKRDNARPRPSENGDVPREKAEENEVTERNKNSGQKNQNAE